MAGISTPDNLQCCRLCMSRNSATLDVFAEEGKQKHILKKIQDCLAVVILEHDVLPKTICYHCMYKIQSFTEYKAEVIRTQNELRTCIMGNTKQEECTSVPLTVTVLQQSHLQPSTSVQYTVKIPAANLISLPSEGVGQLANGANSQGNITNLEPSSSGNQVDDAQVKSEAPDSPEIDVVYCSYTPNSLSKTEMKEEPERMQDVSENPVAASSSGEASGIRARKLSILVDENGAVTRSPKAVKHLDPNSFRQISGVEPCKSSEPTTGCKLKASPGSSSQLTVPNMLPADEQIQSKRPAAAEAVPDDERKASKRFKRANTDPEDNQGSAERVKSLKTVPCDTVPSNNHVKSSVTQTVNSERGEAIFAEREVLHDDNPSVPASEHEKHEDISVVYENIMTEKKSKIIKTLLKQAKKVNSRNHRKRLKKKQRSSKRMSTSVREKQVNKIENTNNVSLSSLSSKFNKIENTNNVSLSSSSSSSEARVNNGQTQNKSRCESGEGTRTSKIARRVSTEEETSLKRAEVSRNGTGNSSNKKSLKGTGNFKKQQRQESNSKDVSIPVREKECIKISKKKTALISSSSSSSEASVNSGQTQNKSRCESGEGTRTSKIATRVSTEEETSLKRAEVSRIGTGDTSNKKSLKGTGNFKKQQRQESNSKDVSIPVREKECIKIAKKKAALISSSSSSSEASVNSGQTQNKSRCESGEGTRTSKIARRVSTEEETSLKRAEVSRNGTGDTSNKKSLKGTGNFKKPQRLESNSKDVSIPVREKECIKIAKKKTALIPSSSSSSEASVNSGQTQNKSRCESGEGTRTSKISTRVSTEEDTSLECAEDSRVVTRGASNKLSLKGCGNFKLKECFVLLKRDKRIEKLVSELPNGSTSCPFCHKILKSEFALRIHLYITSSSNKTWCGRFRRSLHLLGV